MVDCGKKAFEIKVIGGNACDECHRKYHVQKRAALRLVSITFAPGRKPARFAVDYNSLALCVLVSVYDVLLSQLLPDTLIRELYHTTAREAVWSWSRS
jgi:hypothetical protein